MNQFDNKVPMVYIPDCGEDGKESPTYKWLARHFKNIECYTPDRQSEIEKMVADLELISGENYCDHEMDTILIGNAFGGFIASVSAGPMVLINPILFPSESLTRLTDEEREELRYWERQRAESRDNVYALYAEDNAQIASNNIEKVSTNTPITVPGSKHRLTDEQLDLYLLPLLERLTGPSYHIVKLCCDSIEKLKAGEVCKGYSYRFNQRFPTHKEAKMELMHLIRLESGPDSHFPSLPVVGYKIQEIYNDRIHNEYRQWSYTPDGWLMADSYHNDKVEFNGREPQTLPFLKGDYVIAHYNRELILGKIRREPHTPAETTEIKKEIMARCLCVEYEPMETTDSLVDGYCVDFDGLTGLVSVADVFPLPFDFKH